MGFSWQEHWSGVPLPSPFTLHTCVTVLVYVECLYLLLKVVRLSHFPHFYNPPFKDYFS